MSLAPWERTRKPNEDEYSTERRLQEQREKGSTESIQLTASDYESSIGQALIKQGSSKGFIRIASSEIKNAKDSEIYSVFAESIELVAQGISDDKAIVQLSDKYNMPIPRVYAIRQLAMRKMAAHSSDVYQVVKTAAGIGEPAATGYGSIIGGEEVMPGPAQAKKLWITKNVTAINMDDQKIELTPSTELYPIGNMTPEGMQVYNVTDRRNNNQYQVKVNTMTDEWKRSISPVDPAEADFQFKAEQGAETIQGQGQQEMASRAPIAKGVY
jgi:hypothetical protein